MTDGDEDELRFDAGLRSTIFTSMTGLRGARPDAGGDLRGKLLAVGGASSKTRSGIDLTRASQRLGVTRRTVERWLKADSGESGQRQKPSARHAEAIARRARQAATTKAGRKSVMAGRRQEIGKRGARLSINARQGPYDRAYRRSRTVTVELDPGQLQRMVDAYENGGDRGFMTWATHHFGVNDGSGYPAYVEEWQIGSVDSIDLEFRR